MNEVIEQFVRVNYGVYIVNSNLGEFEQTVVTAKCKRVERVEDVLDCLGGFIEDEVLPLNG